jgi:hypothetical protein
LFFFFVFLHALTLALFLHCLIGNIIEGGFVLNAIAEPRMFTQCHEVWNCPLDETLETSI